VIVAVGVVIVTGVVDRDDGDCEGEVEEVEEGKEDGEEEEETSDAENTIPERAYRSQMIVVPSFKRVSIVDLLLRCQDPEKVRTLKATFGDGLNEEGRTYAQRFGEKRRWMAWSSSSEVDLRQESIIWPIVVVRSNERIS
jgi:hypothetical protein